MRAIIIDDKDAKALVQALELQKMRTGQYTNLEDNNGRRTVEALANDVHRQFHYVVVSWLQEQGVRLQ